MVRPYWSGQIQISLVSFSVQLFVATETKNEIKFHQIHRASGERVRHQKISAGDESPVEKNDIVKGYEYRKGEYITIEPSEIEGLRVPSKHVIDVTQFVHVSEIDPAYFEKPYFVAPDGTNQLEAFTVIRKALGDTKKVALGQIAFGGREHVIAIKAPEDESLRGLMAYTLRYSEELRSAADYFRDIKNVATDEDQTQLAEQLINRKTAPFSPDRFKDGYEAALRELVDAKIGNQPIPIDRPIASQGKVVNLMDALRASLNTSKPNVAQKKPAAKDTSITSDAKAGAKKVAARIPKVSKSA